MKKILNGVRYDTDKAQLLGSADNLARGCDSVTDFRFWTASLYMTPRSGRYFLAGEGGPMSRFAQAEGQNTWRGGADLLPMTEPEAREWAEQNLDVETIERYFAVVDA